MGRLTKGILGSKPAVESYTGTGEGINPVELDETIQTHAVVEELNNEIQDIQKIQSETDQLEDAQADYDQLGSVLENSIEEGGISVESAAILSFALGRDGLSSPISVSNESFGNGKSVAQARIALESIRETIKDWWMRLKLWVKKMWDKLRKWYLKVFDGSQTLKSRAETLRKKISDGNTAPKNNVKLENATLWKSLHIAGTFPTSLSTELAKVTTMAQAVFNTQPGKQTSYAEGILDALSNLDLSEDEKAKASVKGIIDAITKNSPIVDISTDLKLTEVSNAANIGDWAVNIDKARKLWTSDTYPGNKALFAILPANKADIDMGDNTETAVSNLRKYADSIKFNYEFSPADKKDYDGEGKQINLPNRSELMSICDEVIKQAGLIYAYKKDFENREKLMDKLKKADGKMNNGPSSGDIEGASTVLSSVSSIINAVSTLMSQPTTLFSGYIMSTGKTSLNFVNSVLGRYDAKD